MKSPANCKSIEEIREVIDEIDRHIMELYCERAGFVKAITKFKIDKESVIASDRQKEMIEKRREWAKELGLNPDVIEEIFQNLLNFNVQEELEILKHINNNQL